MAIGGGSGRRGWFHFAKHSFVRRFWRPPIGHVFVKLDPRQFIRNPVMFVTLLAAVLTTVAVATPASDRAFTVPLAFWLWSTLPFTNFAEALAEGRGRAQADSLRRTCNWAMT